MSTVLLGRMIGNMALTKVDSVQAAGDDVLLSGKLIGTAELKKSQRQCLLGYQDNLDERFIPVQFAEFPELTGWYEVKGTSVDMPLGAVAAVNHLPYDYKIGLTRVPGYAAPMQESQVLVAVRTNSSGISPTTSYHWVPTFGGALVDYYDQATSTGWSILPKRLGNGTDLLGYQVPGTYPVKTQRRWSSNIATSYDGAARIELSTTGGYRPIIGQQVINDPSSIRISNDLVRLELNSSTSMFDLSVFGGSGAASTFSWSPTKTFQIKYTDAIGPAVTASRIQQIAILRNSPERCVIRLVASNLGTLSAVIDIGISRGLHIFDCNLSVFGAIGVWFQRSTAEASSNMTGGLQATANDASGNKFALWSPTAYTTDLTQGGLFSSVGGGSFTLCTLPFGLAYVPSGGPGNTPTTERDLYFLPVWEQQTVAGR